MATKNRPAAKAARRGVFIGGKAEKNLIVTGDNASVHVYQAPPPGTASAQALRRYREWVVRQCAHIDLGDLGSAADAGRSGGRLKLARVYVELDTTSQAEPEKGRSRTARQPGALADSESAKRLTALGALLKHHRLALLGLPGSGKTTFLRHISLHLAANPLPANQGVLKELALEPAALPGWPTAESDLVPITVVLRRFAAECAPKLSSGEPASAKTGAPSKAGRACHLWEFIQSNLREENLADAAEPLHDALVAGRAVVFFDGLDEVPDDDQKQFVCQAVDEFARSPFAPSRMVLTCRTFSYRNQDWVVTGFTDVELAELDDPRINQFIAAWFEALSEEGVVTAEQARNKSATLWPAIQERGLRELAGNPLQLTNMAVLHRVETLPDNRARLYDRLVGLLLLQWDKVRFGKDKLAVPLHALRDEADCREEEFVDGLAWLAWQVHDPKRGSQPGQPADISELELRDALERLHPSQDKTEAGRRKKADWALRVVAVFRQRGALLREEGRGVFRFPHRSYQEFLAGRHLAQQDDFAKKAASYVDDSRHWWEVVRWAANYMAYVKRSLPNSLGLAAELRAGAAAGETTPLAWRKAYLAGDILAEIGVSQVRRGSELGETCLAQTRQLLTQLIGNNILPAKERALAGVALGKLGDLRKGVGLTDKSLPDIDWIEIPPGPFPMGDKEEYYGGQRFECKLITQPYRISRYPVTVAQYEAFVDADGYTDKAKAFWTTAGWKWKQSNRVTGPEEYAPVYQTPNHPRVSVSWYEAMAFCRWLSEQSKMEVTLLSEAQWERAARHTDGRLYPWSPDQDVAQRCNMADTGIGHTSAVGMFPSGHAVCGAADMAGNVWEWCRTKWRGDYKDYEKQADDRLDGDAARVLRGGAFDFVADGVRCAFRFGGLPDLRFR
jgi:formylglycine-generating enzyme required for sulfatase activity